MRYFTRSVAVACLLVLAISVCADDYGDAPDPNYPTLAASNGARHVIGNLFLGTTVDTDADGQPNATATGDDTDGTDDDDGVALPSSFFIGQTRSISVTSSAAGMLSAWVDFNGDGDWADPGEQVLTDDIVSSGSNTFPITIPGTAAIGTTFARFRVSTAGGLSFDGAAADGEVEDYQITISPIPTITSATYNTGTGRLVVTGTDFPANVGAADIDASTMTLTGEGGGTYTLTGTSDAEATNSTTFTLRLSATDKAAVNLLLNQSGTTSIDNTTYNLAAANGWAAAAGATATIADPANGITVTIPTSTVTFTSGGNGTIAGTSPQVITYPNDCDPVSAVPATGYLFDKWTLNGSDYSTANPLTITDVEADMALVAVFRTTQPEIQVIYEDGTDIPLGSLAAGGLGTDFGSTTIGETVTRTYHILNHGGSPLTITSCQVDSGTDYRVSSPGSTVAAGGSAKILVVFAPTALGARESRVTIENDDADEGTFIFSLSGVADNTPPVAITSASSTSVAIGATVQLSGSGSYDLDNAPNTPLTYSWAPVGTPVAALVGSTTMEPTFVPTAAGTYVIRLTVDDGAATDDADIQVVVGTLHTVTVTAGTGGNVRRGLTGIAASTVRDGVADGQPSSDFYPIADTGYDFLQWDDADGSDPRSYGAVTGDISVAAQFQIRTYTVTFTAGTNGTTTSTAPQTIDHGSNCTSVTAVPDAGARFVKWTSGGVDYSTDATITVQDVTTDMTLIAEFAAGAPEIAVSKGSTDVPLNATLSVHTLTQEDYTFTIANTGTETLNLSGTPVIALSGPHASQFQILSMPGASIAPGGQGTFVLRYKPVTGADHTMAITISNDDADEGPFIFTVVGSAHKSQSNACAMGNGTWGGFLLPVIAALFAILAYRRRVARFSRQ